jgi:uncharacterized membrane protein
LSGVDAARGLAVIGMMAAHVWPRAENQGELLVDGRPSILFAVVAGVALGIVTGGAKPASLRRSDARWRLVIRAVLLIALGVLLWMLPSGIAIILDYYGVMFLLLIPLLFLPRVVLVAIALVLLAAALALREWLFAAGVPEDEPWATASDYLLVGYYPALLWLPLLIVGLVCGRSDLSATRTRVIMLGLGALVSLAGYGAAAVLPGFTAEAHSGTLPELLGSGGLAVAVVAALLLVLDSPRTPHGLTVVAAPFVAIGRMPLTIYTAHVLVIAALAPLGPAGLFAPEVGIPLLVLLTVVSAVVALVAMRAGRRGPLEALLSYLAGLPARRSATMGA